MMSDETQNPKKASPVPSRSPRMAVLPCVVVACCHHIPAAAQLRITQWPSLVGGSERGRQREREGRGKYSSLETRDKMAELWQQQQQLLVAPRCVPPTAAVSPEHRTLLVPCNKSPWESFDGCGPSFCFKMSSLTS